MAHKNVEIGSSYSIFFSSTEEEEVKNFLEGEGYKLSKDDIARFILDCSRGVHDSDDEDEGEEISEGSKGVELLASIRESLSKNPELKAALLKGGAKLFAKIIT